MSDTRTGPGAFAARYADLLEIRATRPQAVAEAAQRDKEARRAYEAAAAEGRAGQFAIERRNGNAVLLPEERPTGMGKAWR